ncbi:MAG: hypothetical protein KatS3mg131_0158 [Candidatus Tectimicrobiota bacterium]|nr:MAG: hypothetical protein KatS3mg131_0158 [Candidatus Tectomicrobia bacterium]
MWVRLRDRAQRQQPLGEIVQALRQRLAGYPDATVRIVERPSDVARLLGASRSERLEIDVFGFDLQQGRQLAQTLAERVQEVAGVASVRLSTEESRPEVQLAIDRRKAAALGIRVQEVLQAVETSLAGTVASTYREGQYEYDIRVRLREADRQQLADLERVVVLAPGGQRVPLRSLVAVQPGRGPITIQRRGQERVITVQVGLSGERDFGSVAAEVERLLATVPVPEGFHVVVAGERQEQRAATRNAVFTIVLAVLLVYMIMAALFESLLQPLIMLCTVPFALIGVLVVLWLTGTRVSMPVYIGAILLVGIAVNNGIVMVDYINRLRQQGLAVLAATVQGAATRLRPVLITTLTTVLALIPMALGLGEGGEVWAPLGRVVVGGLTVATLFTLFFVPALYSLLEEARAARRQVAVAVPEVPAAVPE